MKWVILGLYEAFIISMMVWAIVLIRRSKRLGAQMANDSDGEIEVAEMEEESADENITE